MVTGVRESKAGGSLSATLHGGIRAKRKIFQKNTYNVVKEPSRRESRKGGKGEEERGEKVSLEIGESLKGPPLTPSG